MKRVLFDILLQGGVYLVFTNYHEIPHVPRWGEDDAKKAATEVARTAESTGTKMRRASYIDPEHALV